MKENLTSHELNHQPYRDGIRILATIIVEARLGRFASDMGIEAKTVEVTGDMSTFSEDRYAGMLEDAATNLRDKLLVRLQFHLGCRVSEVLSITVKNIDFEKGTVIVNPKAKGKVTGPHKGNQPSRTLPIDEITLRLLKEYLERGGAVTRDGREYLFGISRYRVWQVIKGLSEKAGLPKLANPQNNMIYSISSHKIRQGDDG